MLFAYTIPLCSQPFMFSRFGSGLGDCHDPLGRAFRVGCGENSCIQPGPQHTDPYGSSEKSLLLSCGFPFRRGRLGRRLEYCSGGCEFLSEFLFILTFLVPGNTLWPLVHGSLGCERQLISPKSNGFLHTSPLAATRAWTMVDRNSVSSKR